MLDRIVGLAQPHHGAQGQLAGAIRHGHLHRSVAHHLQDGPAGMLEAGPDEHAHGGELGQERPDGGRVIAPAENRPPEGAQPDHLAADVEVFEEEALREVGGGVRRHRGIINPPAAPLRKVNRAPQGRGRVSR